MAADATTPPIMLTVAMMNMKDTVVMDIWTDTKSYVEGFELFDAMRKLEA